MGRLRVNMGIHPMGFQWHLAFGESFYTPECVLVRSDEGLGGMSRVLHRLYLDTLLPKNWSDASPPILLNSWVSISFLLALSPSNFAFYRRRNTLMLITTT